MSLFNERIIPCVDKLKFHFDIPGYENHGYDANGIYGLEVVELLTLEIPETTSEQITVFCNIHNDHAMIMCRERESSMYLNLGFDNDLIYIDYDLRTDDFSTVKNISTEPVFDGIQLSTDEIEYCKDLFIYLQSKRIQYEEENDQFTEDYFD